MMIRYVACREPVSPAARPLAKDCRRTQASAAGVLTILLAAAGCGGEQSASSADAPAQAAVVESAQDAAGQNAPSTASSLPRVDPPPPTPASAPFAASVSAVAANAGALRLRANDSTGSVLEWLDTEPPRGSAGAPVIVVVPGGLPGRGNVMGVPALSNQ